MQLSLFDRVAELLVLGLVAGMYRTKHIEDKRTRVVKLIIKLISIIFFNINVVRNTDLTGLV